MEITRKITVDTEIFEVGDVIHFKLSNGEKVKAMAVRETPEGMLFATVDCVGSEQPMFKDIDKAQDDDVVICYFNSDLRQYLKNELLPMFPEEIRSRMIGMKVENEYDLLRIPTEKEIFGENVYGQEEGKVKRFKGMKKRRNRIAFDRSQGEEDWEWYWLMNRNKEYASSFALVGSSGYAYSLTASNSYGVRPVFLLS